MSSRSKQVIPYRGRAAPIPRLQIKANQSPQEAVAELQATVQNLIDYITGRNIAAPAITIENGSFPSQSQGWSQINFTKIFSGTPVVLATQGIRSSNPTTQKLVPPTLKPPTVSAPTLSAPVLTAPTVSAKNFTPPNPISPPMLTPFQIPAINLSKMQAPIPATIAGWGTQAQNAVNAYINGLGWPFFLAPVESFLKIVFGNAAYYVGSAAQALFYSTDWPAAAQAIVTKVEAKAAADYDLYLSGIQQIINSDIIGAPPARTRTGALVPGSGINGIIAQAYTDVNLLIDTVVADTNKIVTTVYGDVNGIIDTLAVDTNNTIQNTIGHPPQRTRTGALVPGTGVNGAIAQAYTDVNGALALLASDANVALSDVTLISQDAINALYGLINSAIGLASGLAIPVVQTRNVTGSGFQVYTPGGGATVNWTAILVSI